ncbi:RNA polymerase sigma factor SigZ [hydrothermal vent metagenome]|uniref:RNA polymerase sigma factor SigZ n=1 Tax=hydrothermal vent metagenome TaxID=652676 RepID=A0A1W1CIS2_9ZZZZ
MIWEEYERELSSFVLSRVGDIEIQKEVMQEVALKIFTSLHLQKEHLRGWLYMLTKNVITDYYRKSNKPLPEFEEEVLSPNHILADCLRPMLNSLKDQEKAILELTQLQQFSLSEVATQKNIPINTVKSQLFRAKKSLAEKFFSCCEYERNTKGEVVGFSGCGDKSC